MAYLLPQLLNQSAARDPAHEAVAFKDQHLTYGELEQASNRLAHALITAGVRRGDRVGIYLAKSPASLISIYGILKTGAAYVPIDPGAPRRRLAYIVGNCRIQVLITSNDRLGRLRQAFPDSSALETALIADWDAPREAAAPPGVQLIAWGPALAGASDAAVTLTGVDTDLAYILYTSGSTGEPKGVMLSHRNALTFVDWATERFAVTPEDRLSSHAPLHFDLSIFDLFVAAAAGATLVLVPTETTLFPLPQAQLMEDARITVWYSVPSALIMMLTHVDFRELRLDQLRLVLFAGEVFPVKYLRQLHEALPHAA